MDTNALQQFLEDELKGAASSTAERLTVQYIQYLIREHGENLGNIAIAKHFVFI